MKRLAALAALLAMAGCEREPAPAPAPQAVQPAPVTAASGPSPTLKAVRARRTLIKGLGDANPREI